MNEIELLYKNAGIEVPIVRLKTFKDDNGKIYTQPPFTAEKQLEIMKFIIKKGYYCDEKETEFNGEKYCFCVDYVPFKRVWNTFEEAIAKYINDIWRDLTEEEKGQIRGILE